MRQILCGLLLLLVSVVPASAADWYVLEGASGTGSGADWTNAFTTVAAAETAASRGDTIYIGDGAAYGSPTFNTAASGTTRITVKKATASDHGTETGWNSTFGDGVAVFTKITISSSYWTIDGATGGGPGSWRTGHGFKIDMPSNGKGLQVNAAVTGVIIQHVEIEGDQNGSATSGDGLYVCCATVTSMQLRYLWVHDTSRTNMLARSIGGDWIIEYSLFERANTNAGVHSEIWSVSDGSPDDWILRYNVIADPISTGGLLTTGDRWKVYGNIFTTTRTNVNTNHGIMGGWSSSATGSHQVYNNTFVKYGVKGQLFPVTGGSGSIVRNNLFCDVASFVNPATTKSHNAFRNTTIPSGETNTQSFAVACGSVFTSYGGSFWDSTDDYSLQAATDAGMTLGAEFNTDMFGNIRGADGVWDRGAIEFEAGAAALNILTTTLPGAIVGAAYSQTVQAGGGTSPYTFGNNSAGTSLNDADAECAGLSIATSGAVTGTPTTAGTCSWTADVTDSAGTPGTDTQALSIVVSTISITTSATLTGGLTSRSYSITLTATGGTAPYGWAVTAGTLPDGLSLSTGGVLSGTPTAAGTSVFTITVTDDNSATDAREFSLTITTPSEALVDTGLVVQYFVDEAESGSTPTTIVDWGGSGSHLTLNYGSGNLAYLASGANRGLDSSSVTGAQRGARVIDNDIDDLRANLEGTTTLTLELVLRLDARNTSGQSRVFGIIDEASDVGRFMVKAAQGTDTWLLAWNDVNVESWVLTATEAAIWHIVIDTTQAAADDRVKVYKDGTEVTSTSTAAITQNNTLDLTVDQQLIAFNRIAGDRSFDGRLAYAAVYTHAFNETEVDNNVTVLAASDDQPPVPGVRPRYRLRIR